MTSAVNWAVLGLVIERPGYGHQLAMRFKRAYGDALQIASSHVYPALDTLARHDYVEKLPSGDTGRQPKHRYRATPNGVLAYEDSLVEQAGVEGKRQELWVRQLGLFVRDPATARRLLERLELEYLKAAADAGRPRPVSVVDPRTELIDALVAERHRIAVDGVLKWLRYALARFEALSDDQ